MANLGWRQGLEGEGCLVGYVAIYLFRYLVTYFTLFCCGAATKPGSWPPHS